MFLRFALLLKGKFIKPFLFLFFILSLFSESKAQSYVWLDDDNQELSNDFGELFLMGYDHFMVYEYEKALPYFEKASWRSGCSAIVTNSDGTEDHIVNGINQGHAVDVHWIDTSLDNPGLDDYDISTYSTYYLSVIYNKLGYYSSANSQAFRGLYEDFLPKYLSHFDFSLQMASAWMGMGSNEARYAFGKDYQIECTDNTDAYCWETEPVVSPNTESTLKSRQLFAETSLMEGHVKEAKQITLGIRDSLQKLLIREDFLPIDLSLRKSELQASNLLLLGRIYLAEGDSLHALDQFKMAKRITEDPMTSAEIERESGLILFGLGKLKSAEKALKNAIDFNRRYLGKNPANNISTSLTLGRLYITQGAEEKAKAIYRSLKPIIWSQISANLSNLSEKEQFQFLDEYKSVVHEYIYFVLSVGQSDPRLLSDLYDLMAESKGLVLKTLSQIDLIAPKMYAEMYWRSESPYDKYVKLKDSLTNISQNFSDNNIFNQLEKNILMDIASSGLVSKDSIAWRDIRDKMLPDEVAVEIVRNQVGNDVAYAALIITDRTISKPELVVFDNGNFLENEGIRRYQNAIRFKLSDQESYNLYWKPIKEVIGDRTKIFLSPDGVFNKLNFNTLQNPESGRFLIDEIHLELKTSTREVKQETFSFETTKPVLLGFPEYSVNLENVSSDNQSSTDLELYEEIGQDTLSRFLDLKTGKVQPLPGTLEEIQTISEYIEGELLKYERTKSIQYSGSEATEEAIRGINRPKFLHIATHGFFLKDSKKYLDQDPMNRSGLLLAGCEPYLTGEGVQNTSSNNDGILTAKEAKNLNLLGTELVVLSACETGLGVIRNGEGVFGLKRAFQLAGAQSIIYSLWKVNDETTSLLMKQFYMYYLDTNNVSESFDQAQKDVRESYPDPFNWGAFVLIKF